MKALNKPNKMGSNHGCFRIMMVCICALAIWLLVKRVSRERNKKYTIATISETSSAKNGLSIHYRYTIKQKQYSAWNTKIVEQRFNVGSKVLIEFDNTNPSNSIITDEPLSCLYTLQPPQSGWDEIPACNAK